MPSVDQAREWVSRLGPAAPVGFAIVFAALTLTPFPKSVLSVVAGALWGLGWGLAVCIAAVLMGASAAFFVGRRMLGDAVRTLAGRQMVVIDDAARRSTFLAVLAVRIIPVLPFTLMNFAFGVTRVRFAPFFFATAVGSVPATAAYVGVGAFGADPLSWQFWVALLAVAMLTVIGLIVAHRRYRALKDRPGAVAEQAPAGPLEGNP